MIAWAFQQPGVKQVRTLAPVWNTPALRVAENVGMRPVAADEDDDVGEVLVYAAQRSSIRRIGLISSASTTAAARAMAVTMPKRVGSGKVS